MKLTIQHAALARAVNMAARAAVAKSPRPVLESLRLTADTGALTIEGSDLTTSIRARVEAEVREPGTCLLVAAKLRQIVGALECEEVEIVLAEGTVTLAGGGSRFRFPSGDASEFPALDGFDDKGAALTAEDAQRLREAIRAVSHAAAKEGMRYALNGVHISESGHAVATDGKRLAMAEHGAKTAAIVLPTAGAESIAEALTGAATLAVTATRATVTCQGVSVTTQALVGRYPPWREVIPADLDGKVALPAKELLTGLKSAKTMTSKDSFSVRVRIEAGALVLSSRVPGAGDASVRVLAETDGAGEVAVNPEFLVDAVKACGEQVAIRFKTGEKAGATPIIVEGSGVVCVVMPIDLT